MRTVDFVLRHRQKVVVERDVDGSMLLQNLHTVNHYVLMLPENWDLSHHMTVFYISSFLLGLRYAAVFLDLVSLCFYLSIEF